jgi:PhzF family phenazine biosynthesis protein
MSQTLPIFIADAFTNQPFKGNPAAVCIIKDESTLSDTLLQSIAKEMNLSETAFVSLASTSQATAHSLSLNLRWFTPTVEVALCGHATLATAHVLLRDGAISQLGINDASSITELVFNTRRSGKLIVTASKDGKLRMDFPLGDPKPVEIPQSVLHTLLVNLKVISSQDDSTDCIRKVNLCTKTKKLLVEVVSFDHVKKAAPDANALLNSDFGSKILNDHIKGIILTTRDAPTDQEEIYDFCSRYFSPWNGIPEDPVNGSGHTVQGKYYMEELGKKELVAFQASARTGVLYLDVMIDQERIFMSGFAKTVMKGQLFV